MSVATELLTFEAVLAAIDEFDLAVRQWEAGPGPMMEYRGRPTKAVSDAIERAAVALFQVTDTMQVEFDAYELVLAIDGFEDAFDSWAQKFEQNASVDPGGGEEVWNAYRLAQAAKAPHRYRLAEPVQQLVAGEVPRDQIGKIYGWYIGDPKDRVVDLERVQREVTTPGSEYKPDEWIHPYDKRWREDVEERWAARGQRFEGEEAEAAQRATPRTAPEPLDDLIRLPGMSIAQVAKMKNITEDEVRIRAAALGESMGGDVFLTTADPTARGMEQAQRTDDRRADAFRRETTVDTHPEHGEDWFQRVTAMHADGREPGAILAGLGEAFPTLTFAAVEMVIERAKE